jgi:hypothetical protein
LAVPELGKGWIEIDVEANRYLLRKLVRGEDTGHVDQQVAVSDCPRQALARLAPSETAFAAGECRTLRQTELSRDDAKVSRLP